MADLLEQLKRYAGEKGTLQLRGELERRERRYPIVSVDDHLIEPPDTFDGRLPRRYRDSAPRVVREGAVDYWIFEDERVPLLGADAIQSWEPGKGYLGPVTFDELRPATYDIDHRVLDMDINGVIASLNFPSAPFGFAGQRFMRMKDKDLGLASMRAFNDWIAESWAGPYPDRIIACQIAWLLDPEIAAREIERNAGRNFKAVSFSENPEKLGLPSLYSDYWDPFLRACEETETVVNLHVGSSSETLVPSRDSPGAVLGILFPVSAFSAATDWLFARIPVRYPNIKIVLSEGGIGWVPMMLDRLQYISRNHAVWDGFGDLTPAEVLRRNFWFTTFSDPRTLQLRHEVGVERIMVETDYPHSDSSWPDSQSILGSQFAEIPAADTELMMYRNAAGLYRHAVSV